MTIAAVAVIASVAPGAMTGEVRAHPGVMVVASVDRDPPVPKIAAADRADRAARDRLPAAVDSVAKASAGRRRARKAVVALVRSRARAEVPARKVAALVRAVVPVPVTNEAARRASNVARRVRVATDHRPSAGPSVRRRCR